MLLDRPAAYQAAAADAAQHHPIDPWYRLASTLGASATVGGLCHAAECPVRWAAAGEGKP